MGDEHTSLQYVLAFSVGCLPMCILLHEVIQPLDGVQALMLKTIAVG